MDQSPPQVDAWLSQILERDPLRFEDAYWGHRPDAALAVPLLLKLLSTTHDVYTRGKVLELLGESGDFSVSEALGAELTHPDEQVREWARLAIFALNQGTPWQPTLAL